MYTLFWGLRYDVGADYLSYVSLFDDMSDDIEVGYKIINNFLKKCGFNSISLFILTSFFSIFTLFVLSRKESKLFAILLIYFFFTSSFVFFTQNGIRQAIAFFIISILISKVKDWKFVSVILCALVAILFHKSAILPIVVFIIIYFLRSIKINKFLLIFAVVGLSLLGDSLYEIFFSRFSFLFELLDYTAYGENMSNYEKTIELGSGLGMFLKLCIYIIIILFQDAFYDDKKPIYYFYIFFLIGIITEPIIAENFIMRRMNVYFIENEFIVLTYLTTYLLTRKKNFGFQKIIAIFLIVALMLLYIASIMSNSNKCVPYQTVFNHMALY